MTDVLDDARARRLVLELYPNPGTPHFESVSVAYAVCWCRDADEATAFRGASEVVSADGWTVVQSVESLVPGQIEPAELEHHRLAMKNGLWCKISSVDRMSAGGEHEESLEVLFENYRAQLVTSGTAVLLYSPTDELYGTVTIEEQEGLPVWRNLEEASRWAGDWEEGYRPIEVKLFPALEEHLVRLRETNEQVALCLDGESLTMFHPLALREAMRGR